MKFYDGKMPKEGDLMLYTVHNNHLHFVNLSEDQKKLILQTLDRLNEKIMVFQESEMEIDIELMKGAEK